MVRGEPFAATRVRFSAALAPGICLLPRLRDIVDRLSSFPVSVEHVLLEALHVARQGQPRDCAVSEDVRARRQPGGLVEGSRVKNLHRRKPLQREAQTVTARAAKAELQNAPVILGAIAIGGELLAADRDLLLHEDRLNGERATCDALAHVAVAYQHLQWAPGDGKADFTAKTAAGMNFVHGVLQGRVGVRRGA